MLCCFLKLLFEMLLLCRTPQPSRQAGCSEPSSPVNDVKSAVLPPAFLYFSFPLFHLVTTYCVPRPKETATQKFLPAGTPQTRTATADRPCVWAPTRLPPRSEALLEKKKIGKISFDELIQNFVIKNI